MLLLKHYFLSNATAPPQLNACWGDFPGKSPPTKRKILDRAGWVHYKRIYIYKLSTKYHKNPKNAPTKIKHHKNPAKTYTNPTKKRGKGCVPLSSARTNRILPFFHHYFFKKLQVDNRRHELPIESKAAHSYTSSHCATKAHHFSKHSISSKFFWATSSNWWFGIHNWWSSPFGKAMGTWINPRNPKSIPKKFLGLHRNWIEISKGFVWSGIGMTTRKPLRRNPQKQPLELHENDVHLHRFGD